MKTAQLGLAALWLLSVTVALAQSKAPGSLATTTEAKTPVEIQSDNLELLSEVGKVYFRGHVHAQQGTFELTGDAITATYHPQTRAMQQLEAVGNVQFRDGDRSGKADRALYAVDVSELTMTGRPVVRDGDNTLAGSVIHYSTRTGRLKVQQARTSFQRDVMPKAVTTP